MRAKESGLPWEQNSEAY